MEVGPGGPLTMAATVFLLSPAHAGGKRALQITNPASNGALAKRLHGGETVTLGELFSFLSGLYFRGKLAYAMRFAAAPEHVLVITPHQGLLPASTPVSLDEFRSYSGVAIDAADPQYRRPLEIDLAGLAARRDLARFVLLGSLASRKYLDVLGPPLAGRLFYPVPFPGRGDMSRGALLLRHVELGQEMDYAPMERLSRR
jgi:hypothetical protein